jgi:hypothetical protein
VDIPNRDKLEGEYARLMARLLKTYGDRLVEKLGDPPSLANLPAEFWQGEAEYLLDAMQPFEERIYTDAAQRLITTLPTLGGMDWAIPNELAANWARDYTFDLVRGLNDTTREATARELARLQTEIPAFFERPMTRGDLEARLIENGLFGPVRAEMISVTEVTRAATEGQRAVADELAKSGIIMVEKWDTANDDLVCDLCAPLNGKVLGDGWTRADGPPAHPRCRCNSNFTLPTGAELPEQAYPEFPAEDVIRKFEGDFSALEKQSLDWAEGLSPEQRLAVEKWSALDFRRMRENIELGKIGDAERNFLDALQIAPRVENTLLYRGLKGDVYQEMTSQIGKTITWNTVSSTSISPDVAHYFGTTVFEIKSNSARYINAASMHQRELEAILMPGSTFKVINVFEGVVDTEFGLKNRWIVQVEEITGR